MSGGPIGVGLVGYGPAGRVFHAPLIDAEPALCLAAIATSRPDDLAGDRPSIPAVPNVDALLERDDVRIVVVAAPNARHAPLARAALAAGRHVVIDKPFTVTAGEADGLIEAARERDLVLTAFHNRRWDGDFASLRAGVADGTLGPLHTFEARYDRHKPEGLRTWRGGDGPGAGLLYDLGAHLIDQAVQLLGPPEWVWADLTRPGDGRADDGFHVVMGHRTAWSDARSRLSAGSLVAANAPRFALHGTRASVVTEGLDPQEDQLRGGTAPGGTDYGLGGWHGAVVRPDGRRDTLAPMRGNYPAFYQGVARAVRGEAPVPVDPQDARDVVALIEAAHLSARTGARVRPGLRPLGTP